MHSTLVNFEMFDKNYMWYSSLFYCHKTLQYFENQEKENFELIRIKYTKTNYNIEQKIIEYNAQLLTNLSEKLNNIQVSFLKPNLILFRNLNSDEIGDLNLETNDESLTYAAFIENNNFKLMNFEKNSLNTIKITFLMKDGEVVTPENTTDLNARIVFTDTEVEPPFNSEGYILPNSSLNVIM